MPRRLLPSRSSISLSARRLVWASVGLALTVWQFGKSVVLLSQDQEGGNNLHSRWSDNEQAFLPTSASARSVPPHPLVALPLLKSSSGLPLVVDILSIGSLHRPDYLQAQRETLASSSTVHVRYFVGVTQEDSDEPSCEQRLNVTDIEAIARFCKVTADKKKKSVNKMTTSANMTASAYQTGSILHRLRARYAAWNGFLDQHKNPAGWICAQRRVVDALWRLLQYYEQMNTAGAEEGLPDYLFMMDDDTYVNMPEVLHYLQTLYNTPENSPLVMAGCMIRFLFQFPEFMTIPFGGWGTIISKAALQNLLRPIDCSIATTTEYDNSNDSRFTQNACRRLQQNFLYEQSYYRPNMSVAQLMHAYQSDYYQHYSSWNETNNFCMHSDWMTGYFFQYYNIGSHTGDPTFWNITQSRMTSYRRSEQIAGKLGLDAQKRMALEGQCRFQNATCTQESHICHYMTPTQMYELHKKQAQRHQNDAAAVVHGEQTGATTANGRMMMMIQHPVWKALWMRRDGHASSSRVSSVPRTTITPIQTSATIKTTTTTRLAKNPLTTKIPVFVYPFMNHTIEHEIRHYVWDGLHRSTRLAWTIDGNATDVWMIDVHRAGLRLKPFCTRVLQLLAQAKSYKQQQQMQQHDYYYHDVLSDNVTMTTMMDRWKVVFLYWEDSPMDDFLDCFRTTRLTDSLRIYRYKRSMVTSRHWNESTQFVEKGRLIDFGNWREHSAAPVKRIFYGVRSDIVQGVLQSLGYSNTSVQDPLAVSEQLVRHTTRQTDASYFWPRRGQHDKFITRGTGSQLRDSVGEKLYELSLLSTKEKASQYSIFVGLTGDADDAGRNEAQEAYIKQMLDSKIVVVAQKDRWEDHYRLMEALTSGALVLTDPMLTLPEGLIDGTSVVEYKSLEDLVSKVKFYLNHTEERQNIALEGFRVAMNRHRSWHMMEKIVLDDLLMG